MATKQILNAVHIVVRGFFHVILIPVLAVLKGINALLTHLITEISKV